jgi:predicted kinase
VTPRLVLDIDEVRMGLADWAARPESKLEARSLALEVAAAWLAAGDDVVVPQLLGRPQFIEALAEVADGAGATFVEVLLLAPLVEVGRRLDARRAAFAAAGRAHPADEIEPRRQRAMLRSVDASLRSVAEGRPGTVVVDAAGNEDVTIGALLRLLDAP